MGVLNVQRCKEFQDSSFSKNPKVFPKIKIGHFKMSKNQKGRFEPGKNVNCDDK